MKRISRILTATVLITILCCFSVSADDSKSAGERIYLSHFSGYIGVDAVEGELYGENFFIMSDDEYVDDQLKLIKKAFACVIEKNGDEYTIVHTAQYEDKSDWREKWLENEDGNERFVFVAYFMNDNNEYPDIYNFEMQSFRSVAFGFDPSKVMSGDGEEGAYIGKKVYFYNVDFENRALATSGEWATPKFKSKSYFTVGEPDSDPTVSSPTATIDDNDSVVHEIKLAKKLEVPTVPSSSVSSRSSVVFGALAILLSAAAVIIISFKLYKKQKNKSTNHHSSSGRTHHHSSASTGSHRYSSSSSGETHHHHHHSSDSNTSEDSNKLFGEDVVKHHHHHHHSPQTDEKPESDSIDTVTHED